MVQMCEKAEVTNEHEALPCSENQSRLSTLMLVDIDHTTITRSIITIHVVVITRLLIIAVDAHHVVQIGRNIAAHNIVNARLLRIIRIRLTPIISLKQREYFDERSKE